MILGSESLLASRCWPVTSGHSLLDCHGSAATAQQPLPLPSQPQPTTAHIRDARHPCHSITTPGQQYQTFLLDFPLPLSMLHTRKSCMMWAAYLLRFSWSDTIANSHRKWQPAHAHYLEASGISATSPTPRHRHTSQTLHSCILHHSTYCVWTSLSSSACQPILRITHQCGRRHRARNQGWPAATAGGRARRLRPRRGRLGSAASLRSQFEAIRQMYWLMQCRV